ncbi:non-ribosomal peptide synthetase module [Paenibacillus sp. CC-CFT747]|nr:non-ribosomal peptide synthetase module [Paenibacillus sp. CC-CFT747]
MAQRLATEYVKTCLVLTEAEMDQFIQLFVENQTPLQVKVLDNGSQELVFQDEADGEIVLSFERNAGKYVCTGSCRVSSQKLANAMRKAVSAFKGSALVNRHYTGFSMMYQYERGQVTKIVELKNGRHKVVYEYKDTLGEMERLFKLDEVEREISSLHGQVDELLDLRNRTEDPAARGRIDQDLRMVTKRMFALEA